MGANSTRSRLVMVKLTGPQDAQIVIRLFLGVSVSKADNSPQCGWASFNHPILRGPK